MNTLKMSAKVKLDVKRKTLPSGIITLCILFLSANVLAQTEEWKSAESKDGKIKTKYNISKRIDETGNQVPLIQYTATTTENVSMRRCVELMKDVSKHKEFQGDDVSKKVKAISDNDWILYYFTKRAGLFPGSDCVVRMAISEDSNKKTVIFTLDAAPAMFEKTEEKRFKCYSQKFAFEEKGIDNVKITVTAKMSPTFAVPVWMIQAAFPRGAFDVLQKFVKIAKEG